jgi:hypothetical protein
MKPTKKEEELINKVSEKFPDMENHETWIEYRDRKLDDLTEQDIEFLNDAIKLWDQLQDRN